MQLVHVRSWKQKPVTLLLAAEPLRIPHRSALISGKMMQTKTFNCMKSKSIRQAADEQRVRAESLGGERPALEAGFPGHGIQCNREVFCLCRTGYHCASTLRHLPVSPAMLNFL